MATPRVFLSWNTPPASLASPSRRRVGCDKGEWASFIDILELLIFRVTLFSNVEGLMDLAVIDAFLSFHHGKESPVVGILTDMYDTFDQRCEKSGARIICCTSTLYVWLVSHLFRHEGRPVCSLQGYCSCAEKGKANWDQLLASMEGASVNWFPRWKEGRTENLSSCEGFQNVPLMGTRGCINYNPIIPIKTAWLPHERSTIGGKHCAFHRMGFQ